MPFPHSRPTPPLPHSPCLAFGMTQMSDVAKLSRRTAKHFGCYSSIFFFILYSGYGTLMMKS